MAAQKAERSALCWVGWSAAWLVVLLAAQWVVVKVARSAYESAVALAVTMVFVSAALSVALTAVSSAALWAVQ